MEHHIYLTFFKHSPHTKNNPYNPQKLEKTVVNLTEIAP